MLVLSVLVLPVLVAIWFVPWFVTQDGPAHLYNAHIMTELLKADSPFREVYTLYWYPLPNLAGHLLLMGLMSIQSARTADRVVMSLTFVGFASSVVWLRWQVAGWKGMWLIAPLAVLLALNWMWLMGFYSFMLGASLFPITLGVWWVGREQMNFGRVLAVAVLLVLGYLCHLVSLGLTAGGLGVLCLLSPGPGWRRRCLWTAASIAPLVPLGVMYRGLMQARGGEVHPTWRHVSNIWSPGSWFEYLVSVVAADPLRLSIRRTFPFVDWTSSWFHLLTPTMWMAAGLGLLVLVTIFAHRKQNLETVSTHGAWAVLALLLFIGWFIGPDDFGEQHGGYLRERVMLLGLVAIVPFLKLDSKKPVVYLGAAAVAVAAALQSAIVWDYALNSNRVVSEFMQAKPYIGNNRRVGSLMVINRGRTEVNPLQNIDSIFGIGTNNIVWCNYEAAEYFFPVKYRADLATSLPLRISTVETPIGSQFSVINKLIFRGSNEGAAIDGGGAAITESGSPRRRFDERARRWTRLLAKTHREIDVLVIWGFDPPPDLINTQWYDPKPVFETENVRVFQHR